MFKVIIWGSGREYEKYATLIKYYEEKRQFSVVGITSNDNYFTFLDRYKFIQKKDLANIEYDWIIACASKDVIENIRKQAIFLNITEDIILSAHILQFPDFDFEKYIKLVKSKISIFANICWGGIAYHRLGLKVRSPFYNMGENAKEYVQFLKNAKEILLNERLQFLKMGYERRLKINYPIYNLGGGMQLHMNHYLDKEEAERKWYERLGRINWDNLFVMMCSDDLECIMDFAKLSYKKKICFTSLNVNIPFICHIPLDKLDSSETIESATNASVIGRYKLYNLMDLLLDSRIVNSRIQ